MEDNRNDKPVDYRVHESILARMERANKRWFILCVVIFLAAVGSNIGWLVYESQYEDTVITAEQSGQGVNIVGGGEVMYGAESDNKNP